MAITYSQANLPVQLTEQPLPWSTDVANTVIN